MQILVITTLKIPRYIEFVSEYPMPANGTIRIFKLQPMAIDSLGLETAAAIKAA